ncbi:hypothetical protein CDL20_06795 [Mediterraneibacter gnavus]|uniref:Class C sortase n=2 Tax=Mediterraneibacter gnavus TaxID=33038 RepID=A0A2N5Q0P6_MEDGN|nr:hypothetical protein CDL20_06795 [Mediterraneibacter gnavus]
MTGILLLGAGLIAYPSFSDFVNQQFAYKVITEYEEAVGQSDQAQMQEEIKQAQIYNQSLAGLDPADPFTGENLTENENDAAKISMCEDGKMLGYIQIDKIDVYCPIYYGTSEEVLNKGIGVVEHSSLPVGGSGTHSVLAGHSGLPSRKLFTDIDQLEMGDLIFIHVLDQNFAYRVNQSKIVLPTETDDLKIQKDKDEITLLTCTPYGINTHRLLVRAEWIDYDFDAKESDSEVKHKKDWMWVYVGIACMIAVPGTASICLKRRKGKRNGK